MKKSEIVFYSFLFKLFTTEELWKFVLFMESASNKKNNYVVHETSLTENLSQDTDNVDETKNISETNNVGDTKSSYEKTEYKILYSILQAGGKNQMSSILRFLKHQCQLRQNTLVEDQSKLLITNCNQSEKKEISLKGVLKQLSHKIFSNIKGEI